MASIKQSAERAMFKRLCSNLIDKVRNGKGEDIADSLLALIGRIQGDSWKPTSYAALQDIIHNPDSKYHKFAMRVINEVDKNILVTYITNAFYECGFRGYQTTKKMQENITAIFRGLS